jgi:hypothetical protein
MKTPREILLERHRKMEPKLDALRREVLADSLQAHEARGEPRESRWRLSPAFVVEKLWRELVWPCRRIWAGLATAWVVILALNLMSGTGDGRQMAAKAESRPGPEVMAVLREQRQMLAQLLEPSALPASSRPKIPGPRGDLRVESSIV